MDNINNKNDTASINIMNSIQTVFHCCGSNGPNDYQSIPPLDSCYKNSTKTDTLYENGCYKTIVTYISDHLPVLLGFSITLIIFQLFCLIISIRTCASFRHEGYEDI